MNLTGDTLYISHIHNLGLFKNFDSDLINKIQISFETQKNVPGITYFFISGDMATKFHLSEGTFTDGFAQDILSDLTFVRS